MNWVWLNRGALVVACGLAACVHAPPQRVVETVEVKVPVPVRRTPPPELVAPLTSELPAFVAPSDPAATSALTPEGERRLRVLLDELRTRLGAWESWAAADAGEG